MPPIYHITHVRNLPSIITTSGLLCDADVDDIKEVGIAHEHTKERRARRQVTAGPGGMLADYVPFYFAPRSPMLYVIHKGGVEGYEDGQSPIIHLVSSTDLVAKNNLSFVFSNGHAEMEYSDFYDNLESLVQVDWGIMESRYWFDTVTNPDRKRKRQAEFLVSKSFPWTCFEQIGVINENRKQEVELIIRDSEHKPEVVVKRDWYFF